MEDGRKIAIGAGLLIAAGGLVYALTRKSEPPPEPPPGTGNYFVKGVVWPDAIEAEGAPILWYCLTGYENVAPLRVDGEIWRSINLPCEFTGGRITLDGIPNSLAVVVFYQTDLGWTGWLGDSPTIYNVPDGATVTFEGYDRGTTNWQVT